MLIHLWPTSMVIFTINIALALRPVVNTAPSATPKL